MDEYISREAVFQVVHGIARGIADRDTEALKVKDMKAFYMAKGAKKILDSVDTDLCYIPAADVQPVNRWISVKDRLPDTPEEGLNVMYSDCCLVCDEFGWCGMAYYITDGQKSWWEFADAQNKNKIDWTEVSHWQPLPEPPKDGERE